MHTIQLTLRKTRAGISPLAALLAVAGVLTLLTATVVLAWPAHAQESNNPPAQPTGLGASVESGVGVKLTWNDPADTSITGYEILRRDLAVHDSGELETIESNTGISNTAYTDATVEAGHDYRYRIKAINAHGTSVWSRNAAADVPDEYEAPGSEPASEPPAQPTGLQASVESGVGVKLTWNDPADATITGYEILRRDLAVHDSGELETIESDTGGSDTAYTDATVEAGHDYRYRIKAINAHGTSVWSRNAAADVPDEYEAPGSEPDPADLAPTNLTATLVDGGVSLNWDAPAEEAESITGYAILRAQGEAELSVLVADTSSTTISYTDTTATEKGTTYAYTVKALRDGEQSQASNRAGVQVPHDPADLAPTNLTARWVDGGVSLTWDAPAADAASVTGYRVLRGTTADDLAALADTGNADTSYTDATGEPGTTYFYAVAALRDGEQSQASDPAGFYVPTAQPVGAPADFELQNNLVSFHANQNNPYGIWGDETTVWIADAVGLSTDTAGFIYAYQRSDGTHDSTKDFNTLTGNNVENQGGNDELRGIWSDGTTMFVVDSVDTFVYAYQMSDRAADLTKDFDLATANGNPTGIWGDANTIWVANDGSGTNNKIYAYKRSDGTHDSDKDFNTLSDSQVGNTFPRGIWSDGATMYVLDSDDDYVYAYDQSSKAHLPSRSFTLHTDNGDGEGMWHDGDVMWVVDNADVQVYTYVLPGTITVANTGRDTATATVTLDNPDSSSKTVYLRHRLASDTDWPNAVVSQGTTTGATADISLTGLTPNQVHDVQVSLSNTFAEIMGSDSFRQRPDHLDLALTEGTDSPSGIWSDETTMWVGIDNVKAIHAYTLSTGARDDTKDIAAATLAGNTRGLSGDGTHLYAVSSGTPEVAAIELASLTRSSAHDISEAGTPGDTYGIWMDSTYMWLSGETSSEIWAINRSDNSRAASEDFTNATLVAAGNGNPRGLWSDGATMWVAQRGAPHLYAYGMSGKSRDQDLEISLVAANSSPYGLWSDGDVIYVADKSRKIFAYYLPEASAREIIVASTSTKTATATVTVGNPDSVNLTVYLRHRLASETDWAGVLPAQMTTSGSAAEFPLAGLAPNATYDLEASLDRTFATGVVSDSFQNRPAHLDLELHTDNDAPSGIWSDETTIWVADASDIYVYAYNLSTGARVGSEVVNSQLNGYARGLWGDADNLYVVSSGTPEIVGISRATLTQHIADSISDLADVKPIGIWWNSANLWVSGTTSSGEEILAYNRSNVSRATSEDFASATLLAAGNTSPLGIWSDGETMWVVDDDDTQLYGYSMSSKSRDEDREISLATANTGAYGLWSDGDFMYVSDNSTRKLFAYYLPEAIERPEITMVSTGPETATATLTVENADSVEVTLHLRHRLASATDWPVALEYSTDTPNISHPFELSDLTPNATYDLEASLDSTFATGVTSVSFVQRPAQRDFEVHEDNNSPWGIWSDETTMWVTDVVDQYVYAYTLENGERDESKDVASSEFSHGLRGLWADDTFFWVVTDDAPEVTAIDRTTRTASADVHIGSLESVTALGIWGNDTYLWASDESLGLILAYNRSDGSRAVAKDFSQDTTRPAGNHGTRGLWSDGKTMWVSDRFEKHIYAYSLFGKSRVADLEVPIDPANPNPSGLWSDGEFIYVADPSAEKVFAYYLPQDSTPAITEVVSTGPETATVSVTIDNPDSSDKTVYLRHRLASETDWAGVVPAQMITAGSTADFSLSGLAPNATYDLEASLNSAFSEGVGSASFVQRPTLLDFPLHSSNKGPYGIWSDGTTLWVANKAATEASLFAYTLSTRARDSGSDVPSAQLNGFARGLWGDATHLYLASSPTPDVVAIDKTTLTRSTAHDISDLASIEPDGLWGNDTYLWAATNSSHQILAFNRSDYSSAASENFAQATITAAGNSDIRSIWSNGSTMWASDGDDPRLYAYSMSDKSRLTDLEIPLDSANPNPRGLWSDGEVIYVSDQTSTGSINARVFAYYLPDDGAPEITEVVSLGPESGTVTATIENPESATLTVHARHRLASAADWVDAVVTNGITSTTSITIGVTGLTPNAVHEVQVSLDSNFAAGVDSATFTNRPSGEDLALAEDHTIPSGIWGDETTMWVANANTGDSAYISAYNRSTGELDADKSFNPAQLIFDGSNTSTPKGLWGDGTHLWVVNEDASATAVGALDLTTYTNAAGTDHDYAILGADGYADAWGIWGNDSYLWVSDSLGAPGVRALDRSRHDGARVADQDITSTTMSSLGNDTLRGIWSDGIVLWAVDSDGSQLEGYGLHSKQRVRDAAIPLDAANTAPRDLWSDGQYIYVTNDGGVDEPDKVFAYYLHGQAPPQFTVENRGRTTSTLTVHLRNPDSENRTVYLRHRLASETDWPGVVPAQMTTAGSTAEFSLSALTPNAIYDVEASLDSNFVEDVGSFTFSQRPFHEDVQVPETLYSDTAGLWGDASYLWTASGQHIYAYNRTTGDHDASKSFDQSQLTFDGTNTSTPKGLWGDGTHLWVANGYESNTAIGALDLTTYMDAAGTTHDYAILAADEYADAWGIWGNDSYLWVSDIDGPIRALNRTVHDGTRVATQDFTAATLTGAGNASPRGIWSDGTTMWVVDNTDAKLYAYDLSGKSRGTDQEALEFPMDRANIAPRGLWSDGGEYIYVSNASDSTRLFAYYLPRTGPPVTVTAVNATVTEGQAATFRLTREENIPSAETITVSISTKGDFFGTLPSSDVEFPAGQATVTLSVPTVDDTVVEAHGSVTVTSSSGTATVQVENNDRPGAVRWDMTVSQDTLMEGSDDEATITVSITNGFTFDTDQQVDLRWAGNTISETLFSHGTNSRLTITAGQSSGQVTLSLARDDNDCFNPMETAELTGSWSYDGTTVDLGPLEDFGHVDNDREPVMTLAADVDEVREGQNIILTVDLDPYLCGNPVSARIQVEDLDGAVNPDSLGRTAAFAATEMSPQSVTIMTVPDEVDDRYRVVTFSLAPLGGASLFTTGQPVTVHVTDTQSVSEPPGQDFPGLVYLGTAGLSTVGWVEVGDVVTGEISHNEDADTFRMYLEADKDYRIDMMGASSDNGTLEDPYIWNFLNDEGESIWWDDDGDELDVLRSNDDGGVGLDARMYVRPSAEGDYYVTLWQGVRNPGTYTLALTELTDDHRPHSILDDDATGPYTTVAVDGFAEGNIERPEDSDAFVASLSQCEVYHAGVTGLADGHGTLGMAVLGGIATSPNLTNPMVSSSESSVITAQSFLSPHTGEVHFGIYSEQIFLKRYIAAHNITLFRSDADRDDTGTYRLSLDQTPFVSESGTVSLRYGEGGTDPVHVFSLPFVPSGCAYSAELSGEDADDFEVSDGELRFKTSPDFENPGDTGSDNEYQVTVTFKNYLGTVATGTELDSTAVSFVIKVYDRTG